jgi:2-polyprenyl-3-methyl-5-hydroxy-6-metoxy-1,4-benzoquinol methylase
VRHHDFFSELADYTDQDLLLVTERCRTAAVELAWQWNLHNFKDPIEFYRDSDLYQFDLSAYQNTLAESGWHKWYLQTLDILKPKSILDFGGGIGEYSILAHQAGIPKIDFLEVKNSKTLEYALHRFTQHSVPVNVLNEFSPLGHYDLIVVMDVLEHLENCQQMIRTFSTIAPYVIANTEMISFNVFQPQHINTPDLSPYFENDNNDLWKIKEK